MSDEPVLVEFPRDQALVLFDWLARTGELDHPAAFDDQAEQRALWDLWASFESILSEPFDQRYRDLLHAARARVRDSDT